MIIYDFSCENGHAFEGWFSNAGECERQLTEGALSCPQCDSRVLRKIPSGAKFIKRKNTTPVPGSKASSGAMKVLRDYVRQHARDVGEAFPETVRKMHYGEAETAAVYGQASLNDALELREEGIDVLPLGPAGEDLQ